MNCGFIGHLARASRASLPASLALLLVAGAPPLDCFGAETTGTEVPRVTLGKPGPWGELEYTRIAVEPPEGYLEVNATDDFKEGCWVFRGANRMQVTTLFRSVGLKQSELDRMLNQTRWDEQPGAVIVYPARDLILSFSAEARGTLYSILARSPENEMQTAPFVYRPELLDERLECSGLRPETIAGFKRLLYPRGKVLLFADASPFMASLPDREERIRFFSTISRRHTLLVKLLITPQSDIEQLDNYWSTGGRRKDLFSLLNSLKRLPQGGSIDVTHLLPAFARKRIYAFPRPSEDPDELKRNCHWTAFNFFNDPPDERFCDPQFIQKTAVSDYEQVASEPSQWKLGDLIVLFDGSGDSVHSAVYLADDIVFTKNGNAFHQPWIFMHLPDMLEGYAATAPPEEPLTMVVLRKKAVPAAGVKGEAAGTTQSQAARKN